MQKDKKFHFSIIDIFIVLMVVLVIAAFCYYAAGAWRSEADSSLTGTEYTVKYTFYDKEVNPEICELISVGDVIRESSKDTIKGTVTELAYVDNYVNYEAYNMETGDTTPADHPYYKSVEIVIESPCTIVNNTAYIEDMEIKVGKQINLKSSKYALAGYIVSVEVTEK